MKATLILENGEVFRGVSIGSEADRICEMVFNTSMTGYQEILTNPSCAGQGIVMSYPLIGNCGVNSQDNESPRPWAECIVVRHLTQRGSNFRCEGNLGDYLKQHNIAGIQGVDTRALIRTLRSKGTMNGMITCAENFSVEEYLPAIRAYRAEGAVERVTRKTAETFEPHGKPRHSVAVMDYGVTESLIECLRQRDCAGSILPASTPAEAVLCGGFDGVMLSGGPGDPSENEGIIEQVRKLYDSGLPIFAVGLGHQLMALATGATTGKMRHGHRGANQPVRDTDDGRLFITTQSHGYVVLRETVDPTVAEISHENVSDRTVEGLRYKKGNVFTTQFYPEAPPGPKDTKYLLDRFIGMMGGTGNA